MWAEFRANVVNYEVLNSFNEDPKSILFNKCKTAHWTEALDIVLNDIDNLAAVGMEYPLKVVNEQNLNETPPIRTITNDLVRALFVVAFKAHRLLQLEQLCKVYPYEVAENMVTSTYYDAVKGPMSEAKIMSRDAIRDYKIANSIFNKK